MLFLVAWPPGDGHRKLGRNPEGIKRIELLAVQIVEKQTGHGNGRREGMPTRQNLVTCGGSALSSQGKHPYKGRQD